MPLAASLDVIPRLRSVLTGHGRVQPAPPSAFEVAADAPLRMGATTLGFLVCDGVSLVHA